MRRKLSLRLEELLAIGELSDVPHSPQNLAVLSRGAPQVGQAGTRSGRV